MMERARGRSGGKCCSRVVHDGERCCAGEGLHVDELGWWLLLLLHLSVAGVVYYFLAAHAVILHRQFRLEKGMK